MASKEEYCKWLLATSRLVHKSIQAMNKDQIVQILTDLKIDPGNIKLFLNGLPQQAIEDLNNGQPVCLIEGEIAESAAKCLAHS